VEDTEIGETLGKFLVRSQDGVEQDTVTGAVHGLQSEILFFDLEGKHVVLVLSPMAGSLPQSVAVHVGGDNLTVSSDFIFSSNKLNKTVEDKSASRVEESGSGTQLTEEEQFLAGTDVSMISLFDFFLELNVFVQLLVGGERNTVDSLKIVVGVLTEPVGSGGLGDLEGLDQLGGGQVGTSAQIDKRARSVGSDDSGVGDLVGEELNLERIVLEELEGFLLGKIDLLESVAFFGDLLESLFDSFVMVGSYSMFSDVDIVEETVLKRRTSAKISSEFGFKGSTQNVSTRMPENLRNKLLCDYDA